MGVCFDGLSRGLATGGDAQVPKMAQTSSKEMDHVLYLPALATPRNYCHHLLKRLIIPWIWLANQRVYIPSLIFAFLSL
jgi:hypothetical protein